MTPFVQLVQERRSANNFIENIEITEKELNDIFSIVKFGPSAFNLQHAHYFVVKDSEKKDHLMEAANRQYKVHSSSAVIIVAGDKLAYKDAAKINKGLLNLGVLDQMEYDHIVNDTVSLYETRGESFCRDEAIRNASLSAMLFMLAAKDKGWDTCPMIGFDPDKVREILNMEDRYEIAMMITIGKEKSSSRRPRGYRKPVNEFVTYL